MIIDGATAANPSCNTNPLNMTAEEYFDENYDKEGKKVMMMIDGIADRIQVKGVVWTGCTQFWK